MSAAPATTGRFSGRRGNPWSHLRAAGRGHWDNPRSFHATPEVKAFFHAGQQHLQLRGVGSGHAARRPCIDAVLDYDAASGRTGRDLRRCTDRFRPGARPDRAVDHRYPCACRPPVSCALRAIDAGRQARHRRPHQRAVQETSARCSTPAPDLPSRRQPVRSPVPSTASVTCWASIEATAIHTPGHTPACMTHVIGDAAFVGDTLFMPDYGTARCDFPGGDAATLLPLDPADLRAAGQHPHLPVP